MSSYLRIHGFTKRRDGKTWQCSNFFAGMDQRIDVGPEETLLAVTSTSFDISILELFWTLSGHRSRDPSTM